MKPCRISESSTVVNINDAKDTFTAEKYEDMRGNKGFLITSNNDGKTVDAGSERNLGSMGYKGYR